MSERVPLLHQRKRGPCALRRLRERVRALEHRVDEHSNMVEDLWFSVVRAHEHVRAVARRTVVLERTMNTHVQQDRADVQQLIRAVALMWSSDPPLYVEPSLGVSAAGSRHVQGEAGCLAGETSEWIALIEEKDWPLRVRVDVGAAPPELHIYPRVSQATQHKG